MKKEGQLAAPSDEEYCEAIEFPVEWDVGVPLPHLFANEYRAVLAFRLSKHNSNSEGTSVTVNSPAGVETELAAVEFEGCLAARLGGPNDEALGGHPLYGRGLKPYTAQQVINSRWLKEMEAINSVHPLYQPSMWRDLKHFVFWFHDSTFECLAESFTVDVYRIPMRDLLHKMVERLVSRT